MGSLSTICESNDSQINTSIVPPKSFTSCEADLTDPNYPIESLKHDVIETSKTREHLNNSSENYIIPCIPRDPNIPSCPLKIPIDSHMVPSTTIPVRIAARDHRTIRNYNSGILGNRCNLQKIKLSSNASYTYQELNKYPIPTIMKPRKSKRPECIRVSSNNSLIPLRRTLTFPHFPKNCFSNVRSMVNKIDEIVASISTNLYDVVVITETWLNSRITDEFIRTPGYASCRRDRSNDQRGGGLCTYINSRLAFVELIHLNEIEIKSQWFLIGMERLPRGINSIILETIYHPP